jgi:glucose-1-phosphatase
LIKTIFFDLGNVVIPFDFRPAVGHLAQHCTCPAEDIRARLRSTDLIRRFETGRIDGPQFVTGLGTLLGMRMEYSAFCDLWSSIFLPEPLIPESLLVHLGRKHRLLLLSNTNPIHYEMIRTTYPLMRHFHGAVLSYEVGALKPEPEIFEQAIASAECKAEEIFFTDDLEVNVEAARRHGIDAAQFQSADQIQRELQARGITTE